MRIRIWDREVVLVCALLLVIGGGIAVLHSKSNDIQPGKVLDKVKPEPLKIEVDMVCIGHRMYYALPTEDRHWNLIIRTPASEC